jgi:hypothetical protein
VLHGTQQNYWAYDDNIEANFVTKVLWVLDNVTYSAYHFNTGHANEADRSAIKDYEQELAFKNEKIRKAFEIIRFVILHCSFLCSSYLRE